MRLGLCLPQLGPHCDGGAVADFARAAEQLGYRSLWVGDRVLTPLQPSDLYPIGGTPEHPYPPEFTAALDPLLTLSAAAVATTTAVLGTSTLVAPWHNPLLLGRSLTTLDQITGGRLEVGIGLGWLRDEYRAVGVPWSERAQRLDETLDVLGKLWTTNPVEHHGLSIDIPLSAVDLRPVHIGGPPILLAGMTVGSLERVGSRADGWTNVWGIPHDYYDLLWTTARTAAERAGRNPDALRRETRINVDLGASCADMRGIAEILAEEGVDGAFFDLQYATRSVAESLDVAAELMSAIRPLVPSDEVLR